MVTGTASAIDRTRLSRAVALADRQVLFKLMEKLGPIGDFEYLREPQRGLIMVRGRIDGVGQPFNLGEALATRCSVRLNNRVGHGYILADAPAAALAAAVLDALNQDPSGLLEVKNLVLELEKNIMASYASEKQETLKTKVQFFTLIRGENDE